MRHLAKRPGQPLQAEVWYSPKWKKSHFGGLMVCGSVWTCPVCGPKITERRKQEVITGLDNWDKTGGSVFMATYTLQHDREDLLEDLLEDLIKSYSATKAGAGGKAIRNRYSIKGCITALEPTVSREFGFHPHLHVLYFSSLKPQEIDKERLKEELSQRFIHIMAKRGRYVSSLYGVDVSDPRSPADAKSSYITKWGLDAELTKGPVKSAKDERGIKHYSPFQLLELYAAGDKWAGVMFQKYAAAMKGRHQLGWSKGLRQLLGLSQEVKTDSDLAEEITDIGDQLLAVLTWLQWKVILANDARADLLNAADTGDIQQVNAFLAGMGIRAGPIPKKGNSNVQTRSKETL